MSNEAFAIFLVINSYDTMCCHIYSISQNCLAPADREGRLCNSKANRKLVDNILSQTKAKREMKYFISSFFLDQFMFRAWIKRQELDNFLLFNVCVCMYVCEKESVLSYWLEKHKKPPSATSIYSLHDHIQNMLFLMRWKKINSYERTGTCIIHV